MKEEKNKPKHFNYFNFFLILVLVVMLNSLFLPSINSRTYEEVDYSTFLTQVESGKVDEVEMSGTQIVYTLKKNGDNQKQNKKTYYTGYVENPNLVKTLQDNNVKVNGIFERSDLTGFNWSQVPVVLLEMGFMSNYTEDQNMSSPQYQEKMMTCVADGLDNYFKNKK